LDFEYEKQILGPIFSVHMKSIGMRNRPLVQLRAPLTLKSNTGCTMEELKMKTVWKPLELVNVLVNEGSF